MRMRCLGGPNDGEWWDVNTAIYKVGDVYKIPEISKLSVMDFDPNKVPELITQKYNLYRVCKLHFNKDDVYYFLALNEWTDKQALIYQIERKMLTVL